MIVRARAAVAAAYSVRAGDSLSAISARHLGGARMWPALYMANRKVIGGNPDLIRTGQVLTLAVGPLTSAEVSAAMAALPRATPVTVAAVKVAGTDGDGDHDGDTSDAPATAAPAQPAAPAASSGSGPWPGGWFGNCVVERESGGNAQVMNSTGHYGLYQFSFSTWVAAGGAPGDFGHASVGEQEATFLRAYAMWGTSPWAPYDGC